MPSPSPGSTSPAASGTALWPAVGACGWRHSCRRGVRPGSPCGDGGGSRWKCSQGRRSQRLHTLCVGRAREGGAAGECRVQSLIALHSAPVRYSRRSWHGEFCMYAQHFWRACGHCAPCGHGKDCSRTSNRAGSSVCMPHTCMLDSSCGTAVQQRVGNVLAAVSNRCKTCACAASTSHLRCCCHLCMGVEQHLG